MKKGGESSSTSYMKGKSITYDRFSKIIFGVNQKMFEEVKEV